MSQVAHFAINADDVDRARRFYEKVFGWKFQAYGPPGFYMVDEASAKAAVPLRGSAPPRPWPLRCRPAMPKYGNRPVRLPFESLLR